MKCRSCGAILNDDTSREIFDFGFQPWCNNFLKKSEIRTEAYYPLKMIYCKKCELLQLTHTVPKEVMFKNHTYVSGTTKTLTDHFYELAKENIEQFSLKDGDVIIDIGGNDGTQLKQYEKINPNLELINIESADNIAKISMRNKIFTINEFFNEELAEEIISDGVKAKIINAAGVFFHLEELHSVLRGIKKLLDENGVFVIQFMYAGQIIDNKSFDMIYHEHLCYYTLKSLENLLNLYGLKVFDAYQSSIHSGSIIAKVCHFKSNFKTTERYLFTRETDKKYNEYEFLKVSSRIKNQLKKLRDFILNIYITLDKTIYAFGAPAKGNTLLNYLNLGYPTIKKAVEKNDLKVGLYLPQSYIPIEKESKDDLPDYYLLLSHNFKNEILANYKDEINNNKVKFIVPFPEIKIIDHIE